MIFYGDISELISYFYIKAESFGKAEHSQFAPTNTTLNLKVPKEQGKHKSSHDDNRAWI